MTRPTLKSCPFCNGPAGFEEVDRLGYDVAWTVGCRSYDMDCIATQMISTYSTKREAANAWNTRPEEQPRSSSDPVSQKAYKKRPSRRRIGNTEPGRFLCSDIPEYK